MENSKKLLIGLDVGSDSVGWAATDEDYNLYRLKGKTAWGARLFDDASDAKTRRTFRVAGRRLARRKRRINILNQWFEPLLQDTDPTFLKRLEYSMFYNEDKPEAYRSSTLLFLEPGKESKFYKKYPTIWHLRRDMVDGKEEAFSDIRYLYLALHHIIKYRGNFLRQGEINTDKFDDANFDMVNDLLAQLALNDEEDDSEEEAPFFGLLPEDRKDFIDTVTNKKLGKNAQAKELMRLMSKSGAPNDYAKGLIEMFCFLAVGKKFNTKKLNSKDEDPRYEEADIVIDGKYDENEPKYRDVLGDAFGLAEHAKAIYDFADLHDILGPGNTTLSRAFSQIYDSHKEQKAFLKELCHYLDKANGFSGDKSLTKIIFSKKDEKNNYVAFIHSEPGTDRCDIHEFNQFVLNTLKKPEHEKDIDANPLYAKKWAQICELISQDSLMQTVALRSTSVIPMQLHQKELITILDNAIKFNVPGIAELREPLIALFSFRVPYYCGPLNAKSKYSNLCFRDGKVQTINPFNFGEVVDTNASKQKFMNGLVNDCTYMKGCPVLPRASLLFQDAMVWDKLNNIRVNGERLKSEDMKCVYDGLVAHRSKTTLNQIKSFLVKRMGDPSKNGDYVVTGWNENDSIDNTSRAILGAVFGLTSDRTSKAYETCERILFLKTVFTDSKKDAKEAIEKEFPDLTLEQQKALEKMSCKGWATLSKEFLTLASDKVMAEPRRMIDVMMAGEGNMMEVLHSQKYGFDQKVDEYKKDYYGEKTPQQSVKEIIENIPPKMRRSTIQAIRIVQEVAKVAKKDPDVISIEVTREDNDAQKKKLKGKHSELNRKQQLENFLKGLVQADKKANVDPHVKSAAENALSQLDPYDVDRLKGKHLYLYFLQGGVDLYTGEPIDVNAVLTGQAYDTDHIIPQSLMKDDSLDNLVLVNKAMNQHKSNDYPLPPSIRSKMKPIWKRLRDAKMMSAKKYANLTRGTELTEDELSSFVAAQINVVNHSNIAIRDALKALYPNARLIFSKAQYPSHVRRDLSIPKLRDLNDTHHAVDAYLNVVCGDMLTKKFGNMAIIKAVYGQKGSDEKESLNMDRYLKHSLFDHNGVMTALGEKIVKNSQRHDFLLTYRFAYTDSDFYKQTIYGPINSKRLSAKVLIPAHDGWDNLKYGGYNSMSIETNVIVTIRGKKTTRYLLGVPHLYMEQHRKGKDVLQQLLPLVPHKDGDQVEIDLDNPIPLKATVKKDGIVYVLKSFSAQQVTLYPVTPVFLSTGSMSYLHDFAKCCEKCGSLLESNGGSLSDSLKIDQGRLDSSFIYLTNERSVILLGELHVLAKQRCFAYNAMLEQLRDEGSFGKALEEFKQLDFKKQFGVIRYNIGLFTRRSEPLSGGKLLRKSRGAVLNDGFTLVSQSITGLYETEKKL